MSGDDCQKFLDIYSLLKQKKILMPSRCQAQILQPRLASDRLFSSTFLTPRFPGVPRGGFANFPTFWLVVQASKRSWDPDGKPINPTPPSRRPSLSRAAGEREHWGESPQQPRLGNHWLLGRSRLARGVTATPPTPSSPASRIMTAAAPPTFGVTIKTIL